MLQLRGRSMLALVGVSLILVPLALAVAGRTTFFGTTSAITIAVAAISLGQAVLIARWTGRRTGLLTGFLAIAGWTTICSFAAPWLILASAMAGASVLIYGLAELTNRSETIPRALAAIAFYAAVALSCILGGITLLIPIATACLATVRGNGNSRGLHFFSSPIGLLVLGIGIAVAVRNPVAWPDESNTFYAPWLPVACLLFGMMARWAMVRSGHAASPLGCLLICWLIGPAAVGMFGWIPTQISIALTLPAWTALAGMALLDFRHHDRGRRLTSYLMSLRTPCRPV